MNHIKLANGEKRHMQGWKRQAPDVRDEQFRIQLPKGHLMTAALPTKVDLRNICSPVRDQGSLGSCTSHALSALIESDEIALRRGLRPGIVVNPTKLPKVTVSGVAQDTAGNLSFTTTVAASAPAPVPPTPVPPTPTPAPEVFTPISTLFSYYAGRMLEKTTTEDSGCTIRDIVKGSVTYGVCPEASYPYLVDKFAEKPPQSVYTFGASHKVTAYSSIKDGDLTTLKAVLAKGQLVEIGFQVFSYFMSQDMATKGVLNLPQTGEQLEGGHAVAVCGYDDADQTLLIRNSWGVNWGDKGYFKMSYKYFERTDLVSDLWTITSSPI